MAGFLRLNTLDLRKVADYAPTDDDAASNWQSVDVHLRKERCRPKAFPIRAGPPVSRLTLCLDCLHLTILSSNFQKEIEHLMTEREFIFHMRKYFFQALTNCTVVCREHFLIVASNRVLDLTSANRVLHQNLVCCRATTVLLFCLGILLAVVAAIIISHYMRWNYISACSLSMPAGESCNSLPAINLFDSKLPVFADCYGCTRWV